MEDHKGYQAKRPKEIPKAGWKDIFKRVKDQLGEDHIDIIAPGVAFYFFLAVFPLLVTAISIYGLVTEPAEVEQHLAQITSALPEQAHEILAERMKNIAGQSDGALGWGLVLSILISLWSANQGTKYLFRGINIAYDEENERGFIKENALTLLFTLGTIVLGMIAVALVLAFPAFIERLGLPSTIETILQAGRWILLGIFLVFAFSMIYKYAPVRDNPQFKWVSWGSIIATVLWIGGSLLFSWYVSNFGNYEETYGSVAAVIILMLWFQLTAFVILLGAEINSEMEHQTAKDTTIGDPKPIGERDAYHADHVARTKDRESRERGRESKTRDRDRERKR